MARSCLLGSPNTAYGVKFSQRVTPSKSISTLSTTFGLQERISARILSKSGTSLVEYDRNGIISVSRSASTKVYPITWAGQESLTGTGAGTGGVTGAVVGGVTGAATGGVNVGVTIGARVRTGDIVRGARVGDIVRGARVGDIVRGARVGDIVRGARVGAFVGALVGGLTGAFVGALVGGLTGAFVGALVGGLTGAFVGALVGGLTGAFVGALVGGLTGAFVGALVGGLTGAFVGALVGGLTGAFVGALVGGLTGAFVGASVGGLTGAFVGALVGGLTGAFVGAVTGGVTGAAAGAATGAPPQSKKSTSISIQPLSFLVHALSEYVHALIVWTPTGGFLATETPSISPNMVNGANFSLRISTPSKKNLTHLFVCSSQFGGVLKVLASIFKAQVEKADKSTTGVKSEVIGGETDVSIMLKSVISLVQRMVPVAATTGRVTRRAAMILSMVLGYREAELQLKRMVAMIAIEMKSNL